MGQKCRTCVQELDAPHRRYAADGTVSEGCVADDHDGHVHDAWHLRPQAVAIRSRSHARISGVGMAAAARYDRARFA